MIHQGNIKSCVISAPTCIKSIGSYVKSEAVYGKLETTNAEAYSTASPSMSAKLMEIVSSAESAMQRSSGWSEETVSGFNR
jgi:hypothetical protein